jgi:hypothetical protein
LHTNYFGHLSLHTNYFRPQSGAFHYLRPNIPLRYFYFTSVSLFIYDFFEKPGFQFSAISCTSSCMLVTIDRILYDAHFLPLQLVSLHFPTKGFRSKRRNFACIFQVVILFAIPSCLTMIRCLYLDWHRP